MGKLIYLFDTDYEGLVHAVKLLSECMELADLIAKENDGYSEEWYQALDALTVVKLLRSQFEHANEYDTWPKVPPLPPSPNLEDELPF